MTVAELIEALQEFPSGWPVLNGRVAEGGMDDIEVEQAYVSPTPVGPSYDGRYRRVWDERSRGEYPAVVIG